jgi:uncharacterized membrane protein
MGNPIKSFLLGKWLGHPLHPAIVHVPIALWVGSLVMDLLTLFGVGGNALVRTSFAALVIGLLSTALVIPAGIAEWTQIKREKPAWKLALYHMLLNVVVTLLLVGSVLLRVGDQMRMEQVPLVAFTLNFFANIVLGVSGYIGGRMVYDKGIAVARMSKKRWRGIAAAGNANLPPEK